MGLFGKSHEKNPKEQVTEWCSKLRREQSQLERQIRSIQREEAKVAQSLKEAAKKGDKAMKNQLATLRVAGSLQKSTEVMKSMQALIKLPEVAATMRDLSKEMMKAGIIDEMLDDTMQGFEDTEELEEAAQEEVDKVLWEITAGQLGKAPAAVTDSLPAQPAGAAATEDVDEEDDLTEMQSRLEALRS